MSEKKLRPAHEVQRGLPRSKRNPRLGLCYELSGTYVLSQHLRGIECVLVHGTIQGYGYPPNPHAWVVLPDGQVHDPVADLTLDADAHRALFSAVEEVRYTYCEMQRHAFVSRHWGPWHDEQEARRA